MSRSQSPVRALAWTTALALPLFFCSWARATTRPDPLEDVEGCERWVGKSAGNDPSVRLDVRLCPKGQGVTGHVQWSSLVSGWNVREVSGSWSADGNTLTLKDMRITEQKPNPGYRFCTIDRYELSRQGPDALEGKYHSSECRDDATVSLTRAPRAPGTADSAGTSEPTSKPPSPPAESAPPTPQSSTPPAEDAPEPDGSSSGCGACAAVPRARPTSSAWLLLGLGLWLRRRHGAAHG